MPLEPKLVVEAFDRAVDAGDVAALDEVWHPEIVTHSLGASMPQGIEGIRRFVANRKATGGVGHWEEVVSVAKATTWCSLVLETSTGPEAGSGALMYPRVPSGGTVLSCSGFGAG